MKSFFEIQMRPGGLILQACLFLLLLEQVALCISAVRQKQPVRIVLKDVCCAFLGFSLLVLLLGGRAERHGPGHAVVPKLVYDVCNLPWGLFAASELLMGVILCCRVWQNWQYVRARVLPQTVKETLDLLPAGILFGDAGGCVRMVNLRMNEFARRITGEDPADANSFWTAVCQAGIERAGQRIVRMTDGTALLFDRSPVQVDGKEYYQITASDVTEQYGITMQLREKNEKLLEIRRRMQAVTDLTADMFMDQETLSARIALHDQMGQVLLMGRHLFEHPDHADADVVLRMTRQLNRFLMREAEEPYFERTGARTGAELAETIGISVQVIGEIPDGEPANSLITRAIRECAANAVKHADADRLTVSISEENGFCRAAVSNNGRPPASPIWESGGLRSLRDTVEQAGGQMQVYSTPVFLLVLNLPLTES